MKNELASSVNLDFRNVSKACYHVCFKRQKIKNKNKNKKLVTVTG